MQFAPVKLTATNRGSAPRVVPDVLVVIGAGLLRTIELTTAEVTIGRAFGCEVMIDHPAVSRRHAILRPGPPATVQDLVTTNGTRLRGLHRGGPPVALVAGERFAIGPLAFVIARAPGEPCSTTRPGVVPVGEAIAITQRAPLVLSGEQAADRDAILRALESCTGSEIRAAHRLGMSRPALAAKLRLYRIRRPRS